MRRRREGREKEKEERQRKCEQDQRKKEKEEGEEEEEEKRQTQTEAGFFGFLWGEAKWGNPRIEKSSFSCVGDKDFLIPTHLNLSSSLFLSLFSSSLLLNASLSWKDSLVHSCTCACTHGLTQYSYSFILGKGNKVNACTHLPRLTWWVLDCVFTLMSTVHW